jgi:hypothetical protein
MTVIFKRWALSAMAAMLLAGCSGSKPADNNGSATTTGPTGPPQLVAAKTAFWPMYKSALTWAPDLVILGLTEKDVPGFANEAGKAAMWEATFGSPSLHKYRVDDYAIATVLPSIHKGATAGIALPWAGATRDAMPVDLTSFNIDSDAAYAAASADAADWLKKNPDKKLSSIALGNAFKFHTPVWAVMWGDKKSGYIAYVDANSGKVLKGK